MLGCARGAGAGARGPQGRERGRRRRRREGCCVDAHDVELGVAALNDHVEDGVDDAAGDERLEQGDELLVMDADHLQQNIGSVFREAAAGRRAATGRQSV